MALAGELAGQFRTLLSDEIRPYLRSQGFAKSGVTFRRRRGPPNFQGSSRNGLGALRHAFFVNTGTGSDEIDAVFAAPGLPWTLYDCLVQRRWDEWFDNAPPTSFGTDTDLPAFSIEIQSR